MELDDLKTTWNRLEQRLSVQETAVDRLVTERAGREVRSQIRPVLLAQIAQLILGVALAGLGAQFWIPRTDVAMHLISGLVTHAYGVALIVASIRVMIRTMSIDFGAPVVSVQKGVARIEQALITHGWILGLPWWLLWIPISVVCLTLGGVDLLSPEMNGWVWQSIVVGVLGMLGTIIGYRTLRQKADPEMHSRLDLLVTCASIQSAKSHLAELERFQRTAE